MHHPFALIRCGSMILLNKVCLDLIHSSGDKKRVCILKKKIILTGRGTAGHVMPNLALIPDLKANGFDIAYIYAKGGMEEEIVKGSGLRNYAISAGKLRRYFSLENLKDPFKIIKGYFQSRKILKKEKPDIVFSKGGFVSVPVVYAASSLKIPVVLHESDFSPGLANKLSIPKARKICASFEAALNHLPEKKAVLTGSPVRKEIFEGSREKGLQFTGLEGNKPILLVTGGSQGALEVNKAIDLSLKDLLEDFDIIHLRGKGKLNPENEQISGYRQYEFIGEELPDIFAVTDIVVSRAGANTIFEFLALGIPSLLIPLPLEASRGDQILNARFFEEKGFSMVLEQKDITPETLKSSIKRLYEKSDDLKKNMSLSSIKNGTKAVVDVIIGEI